MSPSLALVAATVAGAPSRRTPRRISRVTVAAASLVPDTTYTVSYAIVTGAGEGSRGGSASAAVTVGRDGSVAPVAGRFGPAPRGEAPS